MADMAQRTCTIDNCGNDHLARGYCAKHYARWKRHGDPMKGGRAPLKPTTCAIDRCEKPRFARDWCSAHYAKWRKYGDPLEQRYGLPPKTCKIDDCDKPGTEGHGMCYLHYRRYWRHGDPRATSRIVGDDVARFESYIELGTAPEHAPDLGACWLWTGYRNHDGYAVMATDLPTASAHRWSYRHHIGDLPPAGWDLDHLCRVRHCVNPYHLEPVPHEENVRRAMAVKHGAA